MSGSLVDSEGYPRNDIDVHIVRYSRNQIICLQNDLNALVKEIEKGLHTFHTEVKNELKCGTFTKMSGMEDVEDGDTNEQIKPPFAKINLVSPGSPAETAVKISGHNIVYILIIFKISGVTVW